LGNTNQGAAGQVDAFQAVKHDSQQEQDTNNFQLLSVTMAHVYALGRFPLHHRDPFDRLLEAQSYQEGLTLVTNDPKLTAYAIPLLW
jgi:PIN domain nuclease of toxin-antitoxin system